MSDARDEYYKIIIEMQRFLEGEISNNYIMELEHENKYLTEQNKAFQEQYNTSGEIIIKLRQEKAELIDIIRQITEPSNIDTILNKYKEL